MTKDEIIAKHREYLFPCVATYYKEPLVLSRGKGQFVYDVEGREYLDFFCGILTVSVGHANAKITESVCEQVKTLQHCSTLYATEPLVSLAEKLAAITPGGLKKSFFTNSGTEANETAIMSARIYTGSQEVIALRHGYSGRSAAAMAITGNYAWRAGGTDIAGIKHAPSPYCYRCPLRLTYPDCGVACAEDIEELIQTTTSGKVAAFIAEPIQGVGGFITPPKEYFKIAVDIVRRYGGVFISDEVQTGFGRTGGKWFGIEHWDVEPDIITCAKSLANGVPIGATVATPEVADSLKGSTISTFGGNPVSMAAACATIEFIQKNDLLENCRTVGGYLRDRFKELQDKHPIIGDLRGMGLMLGIELVRDPKRKEPAPQEAVQFMQLCKDRGLLVGKGGLYGNVLRIAPPLIISKGDVDDAVSIMDEALGKIKIKTA